MMSFSTHIFFRATGWKGKSEKTKQAWPQTFLERGWNKSKTTSARSTKSSRRDLRCKKYRRACLPAHFCSASMCSASICSASKNQQMFIFLNRCCARGSRVASTMLRLFVASLLSAAALCAFFSGQSLRPFLTLSTLS